MKKIKRMMVITLIKMSLLVPADCGCEGIQDLTTDQWDKAGVITNHQQPLIL